MEERCLDCGGMFKVADLRNHMKECLGGPSEDRSRSGSPATGEVRTALYLVRL